MTPAVTTADESLPTPRFAPFIMSDDECEGTDDVWSGFHCLLYSLKDALDDLRYFDRYRNEMRELLRETGFHEVARLRKQTDFQSYPDEEFDAVLERLAEAGFPHIALKAEAVREWQTRASLGHVRKTSTEIKRQLLVKLERLATSNYPNEAASALARVEEIKAKYELASSDPFDFDMAELDAPLKLTPLAEFAIELQAIWNKLKPLGDIYYELEEAPDRVREILRDRTQKLEKLVREHRLLKRRADPVVQLRR